MTANPYRIALADDAADIRHLLRLILQLDGAFTVVGEAGTGRDAITLVAAEQPDAIILDLAMPEMDGLEAIQQIRELCPTVKVIALSGFDAASMAEEALARGAHAYLTKGTKPGEMVAQIKDVCASASESPAPADPAADGAPPIDVDDSFVAVLTHELRNQATVIEGMTSTVLSAHEALSPETIERALGSVVRNAAQMRALVDTLSDVQRARSGELDLAREAVDCGPLVEQVMGDIAALTAGHVVQVVAEPRVSADVDVVRFRQILTNLVSNAAKFSPAGSSITATVEARNDHVVVAVEDEGPGIPEAFAAELFKPFTRLVRSVPGTGLGLYLSRAIAQAHGGDLVLARGDQGARFEVWLPQAAAPTTATATDRASDPATAVTGSSPTP